MYICYCMKLKKAKDRDFHLGTHNPQTQLRLWATWLDSSIMKRDLGVLVEKRLNMSEQSSVVAKQANRMLSCINKGIVSRGKDVIHPLYSVLVRSHLEYCVHFGSPLYRKDAGRLERIQRRATRMIRWLEDLSQEGWENCVVFLCYLEIELSGAGINDILKKHFGLHIFSLQSCLVKSSFKINEFTCAKENTICVPFFLF